MKKNQYWQLVRGICIAIVILIHTLYFTNNIFNDYSNIIIRRIINFGTATFIFLAGYFTKIVDIKEFYKSKIKRLIIPLVIWDIVYAVFFIKKIKNYNSFIKTLLLSSSVSHLYYLYVLIALFIIAPLLIKYLNKTDKYKQLIPLLITPIYNLLLTIYYIKYKKNFILYNYWIFGWISYYYLGLLLKNKKNKLSNNKNIFICIICLVFTIIEGILIYSKTSIYQLAISQLSLFNSIYCICICAVLKKHENNNIKKSFITELGDYSFGIYLSHMLFLSIIKKHIFVTSNYFINIISTFITTIIICYIVNKVYYTKLKRGFKNGTSIRKK